MYLVGLSGFRTRRRGTVVPGVARDFVRITDDGSMLLDRWEDPYDPIDSRRRSSDRTEGHGIAPVSAVLAVAAEPRRCKCEKLTPRLPMPPARATTGGLLGQCELANDDREIDLACIDRCDGVVCLDELRDTTEPRLEFRSAWTRNVLPVR